MRRRTFVQAAGMSFIGLQLGLLGGCGRDPDPALATAPSDEGAHAALRQLAGRLEGIEFVGPVCATEVADPRPLATLLEQLQSTSATTLEAALLTLIESDFAAGERIDIGGWQLARSECLLLAAAATEQGLSEPKRTEQGDLAFEPFAEIERWGPDETIEGEIFNPIGNGRGGFWVRIAEPVPGSTRLMLDGELLATHFESGVVTASLEPDYMDEIIGKPGMYPLLMVDTARNVAQKIGYLTVRPRPPAATLADGSESEVFCQIERWGPDHANQGQAFNEQPDGGAAFWVRIGCAPEGTRLRLDGEPLPTTVGTGLVTARVPHYAELERGDHRLTLHDPASGETLEIGVFRVL
ncbi:hypothetical protein G4Y73_08175 [Wenzhouxiangella sp. XN201]|uniref:hypothetical protein n=1 Tax=Wenzhouxiangella sp. XN201 TaxID=2710755 RepID=UPI0013C86AB9|nr:hypothetical protein [Wenzhouxiangella sp. XN201]NEZ04127.1 hypothetical protein [Wenzhouxiangella sp. XN201]